MRRIESRKTWCAIWVCTAATLIVCLMTTDMVAQQDQDKKVSLFDTKADIKAFSKRMDTATDNLERTEAVVDLATLYLTIVGDPRFVHSEKLQGNRGRIAARLQKHNKLVRRELRKAELAKKKTDRTRSGKPRFYGRQRHLNVIGRYRHDSARRKFSFSSCRPALETYFADRGRSWTIDVLRKRHRRNCWALLARPGTFCWRTKRQWIRAS